MGGLRDQVRRLEGQVDELNKKLRLLNDRMTLNAGYGIWASGPYCLSGAFDIPLEKAVVDLLRHYGVQLIPAQGKSIRFPAPPIAVQPTPAEGL